MENVPVGTDANYHRNAASQVVEAETCHRAEKIVVQGQGAILDFEREPKLLSAESEYRTSD